MIEVSPFSRLTSSEIDFLEPAVTRYSYFLGVPITMKVRCN